MEKRLLYLSKNLNKISHIFGKIKVLSMADVKTAPVFNALYGINVTVRMNLRGHFDIVYGTNKHRITGKGGAFGNLNAGGFQKNFRLDIIGDKQPVLGGSNAVSWFAANKKLVLCFQDGDLCTGRNSFGNVRIFTGEKHQVLVLNQGIAQLLMFWVGSKAGKVKRTFQNHGF